MDTHQMGLAVLEARWEQSGNDSVRPAFEMLAGRLEGNPHAFRYDMFSGKISLSETIGDICKSNLFHSLYIGSHGNEKRLKGISVVSDVELKHIIQKHRSEKLTGLYLGSCEFANDFTAINLLFDTGLIWIAGYAEEVDWIDSTLIDIMFWSRYLQIRKNHSYINHHIESEILKQSTRSLYNIIPHAFTAMRFNVYLKLGDNIETLWDSSDETLVDVT